MLISLQCGIKLEIITIHKRSGTKLKNILNCQHMHADCVSYISWDRLFFPDIACGLLQTKHKCTFQTVLPRRVTLLETIGDFTRALRQRPKNVINMLACAASSIISPPPALFAFWLCAYKSKWVSISKYISIFHQSRSSASERSNFLGLRRWTETLSPRHNNAIKYGYSTSRVKCTILHAAQSTT